MGSEQQVNNKVENRRTGMSHADYEWIGVAELARRWNAKPSWLYDHTRERCDDPIPHKNIGGLKFPWGSPELEEWFTRQGAKKRPATISKRGTGDERKERA